MADNEPALLLRYDPDFVDSTQPFDTYDLPADGEPAPLKTLCQHHVVAFTKGHKTLTQVELSSPCQVKLVIQVAKAGVRGLVRVPHQEAECRRLLGQYQDFLARRNQRLGELIEKRTAEEEMQKKIHEALMTRLLHG